MIHISAVAKEEIRRTKADDINSAQTMISTASAWQDSHPDDNLAVILVDHRNDFAKLL
jgi:hypothetical protein